MGVVHFLNVEPGDCTIIQHTSDQLHAGSEHRSHLMRPGLRFCGSKDERDVEYSVVTHRYIRRISKKRMKIRGCMDQKKRRRETRQGYRFCGRPIRLGRTIRGKMAVPSTKTVE